MNHPMLAIWEAAAPVVAPEASPFPQLLVDLSQIVSAVLSFAAIAIAVYALWRGRNDLVTERRTAHELEVLRQFAEILHGSGMAENYLKARTLLMLIPGSEDMPQTRAALVARPSMKDRENFQRDHPNAPKIKGDDNPNPVAMRARVQSLGDGVAHAELMVAIERKCGAAHTPVHMVREVSDAALATDTVKASVTPSSARSTETPTDRPPEDPLVSAD